MAAGIDDNGYPIGFKTAAGSRISTLATGRAGDEIVTAEVRHVGHHQKEAVVEEGSGGPKWRLASDEGVHLKGTDLAPFPLGYAGGRRSCKLAGARHGLDSARPIRGVRLVQASPYGITPDGRGTAAACDTHLFLNGETDDDTFQMLQRVAANTCYLHQTMIQMPALRIDLKHNGAPVAV